jgi:hypothetical protein
MRILIDSDTISTDDYVSIQTALVKEGRFMIVDRNMGYRAIKAEQERLHRTEEDRYADKEKWAHWGKLYGVGAIVVAHSQCYRTQRFFTLALYTNACKQFLSLVDANTGEVISAIDNEADSAAPGNNVGSESFSVPTDWTVAVQKFVDAYPKDYRPEFYSSGIVRYQDESKENAQKLREIASPKTSEIKKSDEEK